MIITPEQYEEIREVIRFHHEAIVEALLGTSALPEDVVSAMTVLGVPRWASAAPAVAEAVQLGAILSAMPDPNAAMSYPEFVKRLARRNMPLSRSEANAIDYVQEKGARYCRGLGNRVSHNVEGAIVQASTERREEIRTQVREQTVESVKWRETTGQLKTRIGRMTGEWKRDLQRIAHTELQNAMLEGKAADIEDEHGPHAAVAKVPNPDACPDCKRLYLDKNGNPRMFLLSELRGESNAISPDNPARARRRRDWIPTLESVHPYCQCGLIYLAPGLAYNEEHQLVPFTMLDGKYMTAAKKGIGRVNRAKRDASV